MKYSVGKKIGKLTILKYENDHYLCECDCGSVLKIFKSRLRNGRRKCYNCKLSNKPFSIYENEALIIKK